MPQTATLFPMHSKGQITINPLFVKAGKATFTVENPAGEHFTFFVKTKPRKFGGTGNIHFLYVGGHNHKVEEYLGEVCANGYLKKTKASKLHTDDLQMRFKIAKWALAHVWQAERAKKKPDSKDVNFPEGYKIRPSGWCGRCGRKITAPNSLNHHYGPECRKKMDMG